MRDFRSNSRGGGGGRGGGYGGQRFGGGGGGIFGGGRGFGGGDRQMFPAICSNCGRECEVPFRPTGEKPVFCNDCFRKDSGDSRPRGQGPRQRSGPDYQAQFDALNQKLDTIMSLLSEKKPKAPLSEAKAKKKGDKIS